MPIPPLAIEVFQDDYIDAALDCQSVIVRPVARSPLLVWMHSQGFVA